MKQSYHELYQMYGVDSYEKQVNPDIVITEDSNSGYQFFSRVCEENDLDCESMNGKSNVFHYLNIHRDQKILVIADGAAFGSEIDRVLQLIAGRKNVALYLPESFEWLVLSSGILKDTLVDQMLENPSESIECKDYFSWERFFTAILTERTKGTYLAYTKKRLNFVYLNSAIKGTILEQMPSSTLPFLKLRHPHGHNSTDG